MQLVVTTSGIKGTKENKIDLECLELIANPVVGKINSLRAVWKISPAR
jgi:hypothetical protein